jgi:hypothetical protein
MDLTEAEKGLFTLIRSDEEARRIFFSKVSGDRLFYAISAEGYFDSSSVPNPVNMPDGSGQQLPLWSPIQYLQKLSVGFTKGEALHLVDDVLKIALSICQKANECGNVRLYYFFVDIVANIPNDRVTLPVLDNLTNFWLSVGDTFFITPELSEKFIPKFFGDNQTNDDKIKGDIVLRKVTDARLLVQRKNGEPQRHGYNRDLYWLDEIILKRKYYERIARSLSVPIAEYIAVQLKFIIRNEFYRGPYEFSVGSRNGTFRLIPQPNDALQVIFNGFKESEICIVQIDQFELGELARFIIEHLAFTEEELASSQDLLDKLNGAVTYNIDSDSSIYLFKSFFDEDDHASGHQIEESFALYLKTISAEICKNNTPAGLHLIKQFFSIQFKQPIFQRLATYLIGTYWDVYSSFFWELLETPWKIRLLTEHAFSGDVYFLLKKNSSALSTEDQTKIREIIDELYTTQPDKDYWKFRWLSALKDATLFAAEYLKMSAGLSLEADHFETSGKVQIRTGEESPLSPVDILRTTPTEIRKRIENFSPKGFLGPSVRGFSRAMEQAIGKNPEWFINDLNAFRELPYTYMYGLVSGLELAWKSKTSFDWAKVFEFFSEYLASKPYLEGMLTVEGDSWKFGIDAVDGAISNLISEGTRSDKHAFDISLTSNAERLLAKILERHTASPKSVDNNFDYPTFAINTTAGKAFRALLDCALRNKRNLINTSWEREKEIFETGFNRGLLEVSVYIGWFLRQFYYLDSAWIKSMVNQLATSPKGDSWRAFMGGYLFENAASNREIFDLMLNHYESAIKSRFNPGNLGAFNKGLTKHLAMHYLWSFDDGTLMFRFIDSCDNEQLSDLIHFLRTIRTQIETLSGEEQVALRAKIFAIWTYVLDQRSGNSQENQKVLVDSGDLVTFFDDLSPEIVAALQPTLNLIAADHGWFFLLEHFAKVLNTNNSLDNAKAVGSLFIQILQKTTPTYKESHIQSIVRAIYFHSELKSLANQICELYLRRGIEFLRPIFASNSN